MVLLAQQILVEVRVVVAIQATELLKAVLAVQA
jgi:hypothetical protein